MRQESKLIQLIKIPQIIDDCSLYFLQSSHHIPFVIRRIYYIMQADTKLSRGFHAHYKTKQVLFCLQGSIKIAIDDGSKKEEIILSDPSTGIFLDKMIWHEMHKFKKNTILLILASALFDAKDYIRDYEYFIKIKRSKP